MRVWHTLGLVGLLGSGVARPAAGRVQLADTARWSATGELSYTDVSGNRSLALLSTGVGLKRTGGRDFDLTFLSSLRYGKSNGEVAAESYDAELGARIRPLARISPFLNTKASRDRIKNVELRVSAAVGADLNLVTDPHYPLALGVALLQDYERRLIPAGQTGDPTLSRTRFNVRVVAKPVIRKGVTAEHRSQIEPVANNFGDYLFTSQTSLRVLLTGGLAFQTSYLYNYDSTPAPGVESRADRALTTGLIVEI